MSRADWIALFVLGIGFLFIIAAISCFVNGEYEFGIKAGIIGMVGVVIWGGIKLLSTKSE